MNQLTMPFELVATVTPEVSREATIQERFEAFHRANPGVYAAYRSAALQLVQSGITRYGIGSLTEMLRWEFAIRTKQDAFKINNNFRSRYARMLMEHEAELKDFFELRELREKDGNDGNS